MAELQAPLQTPLLDIEPPIPPGVDWLLWLQWGGIFLLVTLLLAGLFWLLRHHLPSFRQRWLKAKWLQQLETFSTMQCQSSHLKSWLLQRYPLLKNWSLSEAQQQQLNRWLFSPEPIACESLKAWIETLPVAEWSWTLGGRFHD